MQYIVLMLFNIFAGVKQLVLESVVMMWDLIQAVATAIQDYVWALLPTGWKEYWEGIAPDVQSLLDMIDHITYFVPFFSMIAIVLGVYAAVAQIRVARWALSLIPRAFTGAS